MVKNPPAKQETQEMRVRSLGREGPQEEGMATHSLYMAISACRKIFGTKQKFYMLCSHFQAGSRLGAQRTRGAAGGGPIPPPSAPARPPPPSTMEPGSHPALHSRLSLVPPFLGALQVRAPAAENE